LPAAPGKFLKEKNFCALLLAVNSDYLWFYVALCPSLKIMGALAGNFFNRNLAT
jgi:hypothetical protein